MVLVTEIWQGRLFLWQKFDWEVKEEQVLTGSDIKSMSDDELIKIISK